MYMLGEMSSWDIVAAAVKRGRDSEHRAQQFTYPSGGSGLIDAAQGIYPVSPHDVIPGTTDQLPPGFTDPPPAFLNAFNGSQQIDPGTTAVSDFNSILNRKVFGIDFKFALIGIVLMYVLLNR